MIEAAAADIARLGGPQMPGAKLKARYCAKEVALTFDKRQADVAHGFASGELALVIFEGMSNTPNDIPHVLPKHDELEKEFTCLRLASRNQILLHLVGHQAYAYDIDNQGKIIRLVGNFKGGGETKIEDEPEKVAIELSSHSGLALSAVNRTVRFGSK